MENNGRRYCTDNLRHLISGIFVKYIVDKGGVDIEHCPTQMMLADYLLKVLKGKGVQSIQGRRNGLQTDIVIKINPSFN